MIVTEHEKAFPHSRSFPTLDEGYRWANSVVGSGIPVQQSRLRDDFFKHILPKDRMFKLLGVQKNAANVCRRIEPDGQWRIEVEYPGTRYETAGIFDVVPKTTRYIRFSAWYSRFLPYAVAMLKAEWDFPRARGIDFESVNGYFGTCMGFVYLGQGDGYCEAKNGVPEYNRIVPEDVALFQRCYEAAMSVKSPSLPFEEAHWSCMVYVGIKKPEEVVKMVDRGHWWIKRVADACERMGEPVPYKIQAAL